MAWVTKSSAVPQEEAAQPKKQYTKKELAANWWEYHRWQVILGVVAVVAVGLMIKDVAFKVKPDYQIAWVGIHNLPVDTGEALVETLTPFCQDLNGDGKVSLTLNQYQVDFDSENDNTDAFNQQAGVIQLSADIMGGGGSYIFLLEDPQGFEAQTGILQYLDGTLPGEGAADWQNMCYTWEDCPVLAGLPLGEYNGLNVMDTSTGESQDVMAKVAVARRGVWTEKEAPHYQGGAELWQALTAGATAPEEGAAQ